jgi:hypothetical protein
VKKYFVVGAILGALVLLAAVTPALAGTAPRDQTVAYPVTPGATWMVKLRGSIPDSKVRQMTYRGFAALKASQPASWTDAATGDAYSGVDLKTLVGLIDDKNTKSFNATLATSGAGYIVRVIGLDGFSHDFASADVANNVIVVANKVKASGAASELALPLGTAKSVLSPESVRWQPSWPLKLTGDFVATSGKLRIGAISLIELLPATTG